MLPENITLVVGRNERWMGSAATEPFEAGWAHEAVIFIRALKEPKGEQPKAKLEISPGGMRWTPEGTEVPMPSRKDDIVVLRVKHFGNWLRIAADFPSDSECTVLVTVHLKA